MVPFCSITYADGLRKLSIARVQRGSSETARCARCATSKERQVCARRRVSEPAVSAKDGQSARLHPRFS